MKDPDPAEENLIKLLYVVIFVVKFAGIWVILHGGI